MMDTVIAVEHSHIDNASPESAPDRVVRELDVCLSSGVLGDDTKVGERWCWLHRCLVTDTKPPLMKGWVADVPFAIPSSATMAAI